jgi:putative hydrolase of the HAD superfamily
VLFDAGGVLLDLDYGYLRRLIEPRHRPVTEEALSEAEARARREVEAHVRRGGRVADAWRDYFHFMLGTVQVPPDAHEGIIDSLWEAHQRVGLWTVPIAGAREVVAELKERGFRLAVVSNAEGLVARDLERAGYSPWLETIVDSHLVGVAKPDPAIFHIALKALGVEAQRAVFVGDLPAVDVAGAQAAGLAAILLDRHGIYPDGDVPRLRSLSELPECVGHPPPSTAR